MKRLMLVIISVIFLSGISFSQDLQNNKNPEEKAGKMTEKLNKTVDLSAEQQSKIKQLYLDHFTKMQALRESSKDKEKSEMKQSFRESRMELRKGIKDILTDSQRDKLKAKMKHKRCKCGQNKRHH